MTLEELTMALIGTCDDELMSKEVQARVDEEDNTILLFVTPDISTPDDIKVLCRL